MAEEQRRILNDKEIGIVLAALSCYSKNQSGTANIVDRAEGGIENTDKYHLENARTQKDIRTLIELIDTVTSIEVTYDNE